jgi:hypothetical protein
MTVPDRGLGRPALIPSRPPPTAISSRTRGLEVAGSALVLEARRRQVVAKLLRELLRNPAACLDG